MQNRPLHIIICILALFASTGTFSQSYYAVDFEENKGQWSGDFNYKSIIGDAQIFIQASGYTILKQHPEDAALVTKRLHGAISADIKAPVKIKGGMELGGPESAPEAIPVRAHAFAVRFAGSKGVTTFQPEKPTGETANYILGNNPENWKSGVRSFAGVMGKGLYPGIDIKYYGEGDQLKYDLILQPGADASRIRMTYNGVDKMQLKNGSLLIQTSVGESRELPPFAYQLVGGIKKQINCSYRIENGQVGFKLGSYDKTQPLVIDPVLRISTFTGSKSSNWGFTAAPGPDGSLYAGGIVFGQGYPVSLGAFQTSFGGGTGQPGIGGIDIGLTRFSADGRARIFSTYIGGSGDEFPHSIYVDPAGNAVVLGRTTSFNFPRKNKFGNGGGTDIFVVKLSADGTTLVGGIIIGGGGTDGANMDSNISPSPKPLMYNYGDNARSEVILDNDNNVIIACSSNSGDFPTKNASQAALGGLQDGVIVKMSPDLSNVIYSTYLGGGGEDAAFVLALNPLDNNIYAAGATMSNDFPGTKTGTIGQSLQGGIDGFVAILSPTGNLIKSTYLGTSFTDIVYGIQFDQKGFPYVMGISLGSWPVRNAIFNNPGSKQFISKMQTDLSDYVYSTVYGTNALVPNISPVAFLVDRCENVYVSGWGGKLNLCSQNPFDVKTIGPAGMPLAGVPIQNYTDNKDFYFFVLERDARSQLYGAYFGQRGGEGDHVDGGTSRFDKKGAIYQAICANCGGSNICPSDPIRAPLKIAPGASVAPVNGALGTGGAGECNLFAFKIDFELDGVKAGVLSSINGVPYDTVGCLPLTVDFQDTLELGERYIWDYGDGSPKDTTVDAISRHEFKAAGTFRVMLIVENQDRCIPRDTSYQEIIVRTDKVELKTDVLKVGACTSLEYELQNFSVAPAGKTFGPNSFEWDFGDKSPRQISGPGGVRHTFPAVGTYPVRLYLRDNAFCNTDDYVDLRVSVTPLLRASFVVDSITCFPNKVTFKNNSLGGKTFVWDFGFGNPAVTATGFDPGKISFPGPGDYAVRLTAFDNSTCNPVDDTLITVRVRPKPGATFSFLPNPPVENTPTQFTNLSTGASRYLWYYGDGGVSSARDTIHQYQKTDTYNASLVAYNIYGCSDTAVRVVSAIVNPIVGVPTAFTPNNDGVNDVVKVRGFGIDQMVFRIYNRWGQEVFVSQNPEYGWDGRLKGALQPMDVYGYTLSIQFTDGTNINRKGEITLIR
ncbi:MAG: hypothetical protein RLY85_965 [Bacteroidota bacterium]